MGESTVLDYYACPTCGNVALSGEPVRCCEGRMHPKEPVNDPEWPTLESLLTDVFDMSSTELEICLCVMEGGELTVQELSDDVGYDRSVVSRHLNHLATLGVVEKRRRLLEQGGHTYVYTPVSPEAVRHALQTAFYEWVRRASEELSSLQREKVEAIADADDDPSWEIYRTVDG